MKRLLPFLPIVLAALWSATATHSQIYESKDKSGAPVYSDTPTPGSKEVTLPAPNVSDAPMPSTQPTTPAVPAPYSELVIVSPGPGSTLHTNTGEFNVNVNLSPALNSKGGDRFVVTLDGTALPGRYTSPTIEITSKDWAVAADNVQHELGVSVVNANGDVVIAASPVTFYAHRAGFRRRSVR